MDPNTSSYKHKTADIYCAGCVEMSSIKELFLFYGRARIAKYHADNDDTPLFYNMPNLSLSWATDIMTYLMCFSPCGRRIGN